MDLASTVKIAEDVVGEVLEGEAVLLNLRTGVYYSLNRTGTTIWKLLEEDGHLGRVRDRMLKQYEVPAEVLDADLERLLGDLEQRRLIQIAK
jgi:hypothetical protein